MPENLIPHFIEKQIKQSLFQGSFTAYVMVLDIIGFTSITEKFMQAGKEGAERLTNILNQIYEPTIRLIYQYNGEIIAFEGDALTAFFDKSNSEEQILDCAILISQIFEAKKQSYLKEENLEIGIKTGLAYNELKWYISEFNNHNTCLFESEAICDAINAQKLCKKNQIIAHKSFVNHLTVNYIPINKDFSLIKQDKITMEKKLSPIIAQISDKIQYSFFPELKKLRNIKGEFRNIVSVFMKFRNNELKGDFNELINPVILLSDLYGAYFNKINNTENGIMALVIFGAPNSHENDIQRALSFSNELREKYQDQIKIGLAYGIAYAGFIGSIIRSEYTCLGDTLNISARLMNLAEWGKIYLSESLINKNILNSNLIKLEKQFLKGKKESTTVYELTQTKSIQTEFYPGIFCGRETESSQLYDSLAPLNKGKSPGIVYLYGEAGSGKSRLLYEFIMKINEEINILHLYTDNILRKSLNPIKNYLYKYFKLEANNTPEIQNNLFEMNFSILLKQLLNTTDKRKEEFHSRLNNNKEFIKVLLEIKNQSLESLNPKNLFEATVYSLKNLFLSFSLLKKTCIIIEDLQWIDKDTQYFIEILSRTCENYPLLLIISSRFKDDGSKEKIITNQLQEKEICLNPLEDNNVKLMAENLLGNQISDNLANYIKEKSENNPFFVEQFCLYLKENQHLIIINKQYELRNIKITLPNNINAIIISRVDRLSQDLKEIIQVASVLGREVDVKLLDDMLIHYYSDNKDIDFNQEYLKIEQEQIWVILKQLRYIFRHVLIQEAIYDMQLREQLKKLHLLAAKSLEKLYIQYEEFYLNIAYHYEKANRLKKAQSYYLKAAQHLTLKYDNEKAIQSYQKAIEIGLDPNEEFSAVYNQARILDNIGKKKEVEAALLKYIKKAEKAKNTYHLMRLKTLLGNVYRSISNYDNAMNLLNQAKTIAETLHDQKEISDITGFIGIIYLHTGKLDEAMASFEYKRFICESTNDKMGIGYATSNMGVVHLKRSEYDLAMECYKVMEKISLEMNDRAGLILALGNMGIILYNKGHLDEGIECFEKEIQYCQEIGDRNRISNAYNNLGNVYWCKGELQKALKYYEMDKKLCEELGDKKGLAYAIGNMGLIHFSNDELHKAIKSFKYWAEVCESFNDYYGMTTALSNLGLVYWDNGQFEKSIACFEKNKKVCEEINDQSQLSLTIGNIGSIHYEKGEFEEALKCLKYRLEIVQKIGETLSLSACYLNMANIYDELKDYLEADRLYNLAIDIDKQNNNDYHLSNVMTDYSLFLFAQKEYKKCREYYKIALKISDESEDPDQIIKLQIVSARLTGLKNIEKAEQLLKEMFKESLSMPLQASIYYELWKLSSNAKYKEKSFDLYQKLYKKVPKYLYKIRFQELSE